MTDTPQVLLNHHLKTLKLPTFLQEYDKIARQCATEGVDHVRYLLRLAELELIDRERRMVERRIKAARFPVVRSLDSFDFKVIPSLNKTLVLELARCEYIDRLENLIPFSGQGSSKRTTAEARIVYNKNGCHGFSCCLVWYCQRRHELYQTVIPQVFLAGLWLPRASVSCQSTFLHQRMRNHLPYIEATFSSIFPDFYR